jgi:copper chaperone CopZ
MNFKKSIVTLLLTSVLFVGCKEKSTEIVSKEITETASPKVKKEIAAANLQTASFSVEGMTCAVGCAKTIEQELTDLEGVEKAAVDFDKKTATVTFDKTIQEDLTGLDGVQKATVDFDTKLATVTFDKKVQTPEKLTKVVEAAADGKTYKVSNMKS